MIFCVFRECSEAVSLTGTRACVPVYNLIDLLCVVTSCDTNTGPLGLVVAMSIVYTMSQKLLNLTNHTKAITKDYETCDIY